MMTLAARVLQKHRTRRSRAGQSCEASARSLKLQVASTYFNHLVWKCASGPKNTIHITTISADGVWNGKENELLAYPYKDEIAVASSDKEVQELNIYLEELLDAFSQRLFHGTVCAGTHRNVEKASKYFLKLISNLKRQKYIDMRLERTFAFQMYISFADNERFRLCCATCDLPNCGNNCQKWIKPTKSECRHSAPEHLKEPQHRTESDYSTQIQFCTNCGIITDDRFSWITWSHSSRRDFSKPLWSQTNTPYRVNLFNGFVQFDITNWAEGPFLGITMHHNAASHHVDPASPRNFWLMRLLS